MPSHHVFFAPSKPHPKSLSSGEGLARCSLHLLKSNESTQFMLKKGQKTKFRSVGWLPLRRRGRGVRLNEKVREVQSSGAIVWYFEWI
jgi:hypothetical protein